MYPALTDEALMRLVVLPETGHLSVAHFEPSFKNVRIGVTDSFGNKYSSELDAK